MSMDEEQQTQQKPQYINYKDYKKKLNKKPNDNLYLFITAFFVMLLLFLGIAKQLSPDVDVTISDNSDETEYQDRNSVDDRLRDIQKEDDMFTLTDDETFSPELEEKVRIPERVRRVIGDSEETEEVQHQNQKEQEKQVKEETNKTETTTQAPVPVQTAKVVVGYYQTMTQADVAKEILAESGLNVQPFVKNIGGAYTLQVGSFSSREKAQSLVNDLLKNNFPARIIYE